jgi:uncharacterized protein YwgA
MGTAGYPWERYGLIVELTVRMQAISRQFGKTSIQKMIYLLQALYEVDYGYDFSFYTYGPYSFDLSRDLKIIEHHGGLDICFVNSETRGYLIKPGANNYLFRKKAADSIHRAGSNLDAAINEFGAYNTRDLELRSTIIYADRDSRDNKKQHCRGDFIKLIHNLKPHFELNYIENVVAGLEEKGFIDLGQPS